MSHTLEMLSDKSVKRIGVSGDMIDWWDKEIGQRRAASTSTSSATENGGNVGSSSGTHSVDPNDILRPPGKPTGSESGSGSQGEGGEKENDAEQGIGEGKMPGPGGT